MAYTPSGITPTVSDKELTGYRDSLEKLLTEAVKKNDTQKTNELLKKIYDFNVYEDKKRDTENKRRQELDKNQYDIEKKRQEAAEKKRDDERKKAEEKIEKRYDRLQNGLIGGFGDKLTDALNFGSKGSILTNMLGPFGMLANSMLKSFSGKTTEEWIGAGYRKILSNRKEAALERLDEKSNRAVEQEIQRVRPAKEEPEKTSVLDETKKNESIFSKLKETFSRKDENIKSTKRVRPTKDSMLAEAGTVGAAAVYLAETITGKKPSVKDEPSGLLDNLFGGEGSGLLSKLGGGFSKLLGKGGLFAGLKAAGGKLFSFLAGNAGPIALITGTILGLVNEWDKKGKEEAEKLKSVFNDEQATVWDKTKAVATFSFKAVCGTLAGGVRTAFNSITTGVSDIVNTWKDPEKSTGEKIWNTLKLSAKTITSVPFNLVKGAFSTLEDYVVNLLPEDKQEEWAAFKEKVSEKWTSFKDKTKSIALGIWDKITGIFSKDKDEPEKTEPITREQLIASDRRWADDVYYEKHKNDIVAPEEKKEGFFKRLFKGREKEPIMVQDAIISKDNQLYIPSNEDNIVLSKGELKLNNSQFENELLNLLRVISENITAIKPATVISNNMTVDKSVNFEGFRA